MYIHATIMNMKNNVDGLVGGQVGKKMRGRNAIIL